MRPIDTKWPHSPRILAGLQVGTSVGDDDDLFSEMLENQKTMTWMNTTNPNEVCYEAFSRVRGSVEPGGWWFALRSAAISIAMC